MRQIVVSFLLGLFGFVTFFFGEPFDVPGGTPLLPMLVGGLSTGLYLAVCQFLVARREGAEVRAGAATLLFTGGLRASGRLSRLISDWDLLVAMLAPLAGISGVIVLLEPNAGPQQAPPLFLGGALGAVAGAMLARATSTHCGAQSRAEAWRHLRRVGAGLFCVVSVLLAVAKPGIPELLDLRSQASNGLIVLASLHLLIAAALFLKRTPGAMLSAIAGAFGLLLAGFLVVVGVAYVGLPIYVPAALFAGALLDLCVCGSCIKAVVRAGGFE
jgi:hypothetical protein